MENKQTLTMADLEQTLDWLNKAYLPHTLDSMEIIGRIVDVSQFPQTSTPSRHGLQQLTLTPYTDTPPEDTYLTVVLEDQQVVYNALYSSFVNEYYMEEYEDDGQERLKRIEGVRHWRKQ